ncbi:leucine-rich repeat-containing protein 37B-like [Hemicordylus capensis]|uniref:leucine-rich repeat-containing protein 37B-like n=1 Tax=Hemicordylus capensis TaxID=884348 RepID=UPI0023024F84|nr:leucine-rich repeat-containing protein 37B-like [Hemicordylus capensis]
MNSREAVPFVQLIDLSGNLTENLTHGAFEVRHGMQFIKTVLNHHPLKGIDDASFYRLPSLKLLDLSSTEMTPKILEALLQSSQQLKTLTLELKGNVQKRMLQEVQRIWIQK